MAEGARLEIVCAFTRTVGSNPTLSATVSRRSPAAARVGFDARLADVPSTRLGANPFRRPASLRSLVEEGRRAHVDPRRFARWSGDLKTHLFCGEVPEWSNGAVSKTVDRASDPWVRIPPSPPLDSLGFGRRSEPGERHGRDDRGSWSCRHGGERRAAGSFASAPALRGGRRAGVAGPPGRRLVDSPVALPVRLFGLDLEGLSRLD